jgi:chromosome segregation ATPase
MDAALRSVSDVFAKEQERDATTIQNVQMTVVALNERMSDLKKVSEVIDMVNEKLFSNHTDCELTKQQFSNQIDDLKEDLESLKTEILTKITEVNSEVAGIKVITNGIKNKKKKSKRYRGLFWSCITAIIAVIALLADIKDLLLSFMN